MSASTPRAEATPTYSIETPRFKCPINLYQIRYKR